MGGVHPRGASPPAGGRGAGLTLGLQVAEQRLRAVQGAGGQAAHTALGQAARGAQQWVAVLGGPVGVGDGGARGPDQRQGCHALHRALREGAASEGGPPPGRGGGLGRTSARFPARPGCCLGLPIGAMGARAVMGALGPCLMRSICCDCCYYYCRRCC